MKFEKLSDEKFQVFKKSEVVNPILISGGYIETSTASTQDRYDDHSGGVATDDNWQSTGLGTNFTADGATAADHSDIS